MGIGNPQRKPKVKNWSKIKNKVSVKAHTRGKGRKKTKVVKHVRRKPRR